MPESSTALASVASPALAGPEAGAVLQLTRPSVGQPAPRRRFRVPRLVRRTVGPVGVLFLWWLVCHVGLFPPTTLASPAQTIAAGRQLWEAGQLQSNMLISLRRVVEGLCLGVSAGVILAVLSGFFHVAEDLLDPLVQAVRSVPLLGLLPLFIVWFGVGEEAKVFIIALGVTFPVYLNTFGAIRGVDSKLIEAGRTFGLKRFGVIRNVILPGALPGFLVGLRFALVGSWLIVIAAEQINAQSGLGYMILEAENVNRIDIIFVGLTVYAILGIVVDLIVRLLERHLLAWRRGFSGS